MKRILAIVALCLLASSVFAAPNFFSPSENDQSMYYLAAIFGDVGNVLTQWGAPSGESTLLKYAFLYFNNAVIVLGCILILYTLVVSTINTSHHGEMMGQKWNSVWIPLRSAMGFALLLPTTTSKLGMTDIAVQGYAVIQVFVMWVIVQGVGAADYIWNNMVDQIASGNAGVSVSTSTNNDMETATSAFQYMTCTLGYLESQSGKKYSTQETTDGNKGKSKGPATHATWGSDTFNKTYRETTPNVLYQHTNEDANTKYSYVWAFGSSNPSDWSRSSVCGYITMPTGEGKGDAALVNYYTRQAALINKMIGYVPLVKKPYYSGIYGSNWNGIYPTDGQTTGDSLAAGYKSGYTYTAANGKVTDIPTLGYLAEVYMVYLDRGAVSDAPGGIQGTVVPICTNDDDETIDCPPDTPGSDAQSYVTAQLQNMAEAYQAATVSNYQQYQTEEAAQEVALQDGGEGGQQGAPLVTGDLTGAQRKEVLVSAAKYNGWASAGAFFLDMAKTLATSTSTLSASAYDYSYSGLACQKGVDITTGGGDRRCQDARTATDIDGGFESGDVGNKHHTYGYGRNNLSAVLLAVEGISLQVLGNGIDSGDIDPSTAGDGRDCAPLSETDSEGNTHIIVDSSGNPVENCGVYNSVMHANAAFAPNHFSKPKFPKMIINPMAWYHYVNGMIMYNFSQTLQPIMAMGTGWQMVNPLFTLRKAGIRLLNTSSKLYHIGFKYMWISGLATYAFSGITGIANAMTSAMTWGATMYNAIIAMMMTMGAIMAYYFPLIPYLVFTFAFIQWLILTIEAMTAAPMLCLGILNPEGQHEAFGQSSAGVAILASVFLRPSLMIIGYFAATVMSYVTVLIVNGGFFFAANSLIAGIGNDGSAASMFGTLIIWGMYVNTLMVVLNKSFTLIYYLPDRIMRWIGLGEEHTDIEGMMGEVKGGVKEGADTAKSAADAQMAARRQSMHDYAAAADDLQEKAKL